MLFVDIFVHICVFICKCARACVGIVCVCVFSNKLNVTSRKFTLWSLVCTVILSPFFLKTLKSFFFIFSAFCPLVDFIVASPSSLYNPNSISGIALRISDSIFSPHNLLISAPSPQPIPTSKRPLFFTQVSPSFISTVFLASHKKRCRESK